MQGGIITENRTSGYSMRSRLFWFSVNVCNFNDKSSGLSRINCLVGFGFFFINHFVYIIYVYIYWCFLNLEKYITLCIDSKLSKYRYLNIETWYICIYMCLNVTEKNKSSFNVTFDILFNIYQDVDNFMIWFYIKVCNKLCS